LQQDRLVELLQKDNSTISGRKGEKLKKLK